MWWYMQAIPSLMECSPVWFWICYVFLSHFAFFMVSSLNLLEKKNILFSSSLFSMLLLSNWPEIISSDPLPHSCSWVLFACLFLQLQKSNTSLFHCKSTGMGRWGRHITSSDSCINGSSAIQVLSIKETRYTSCIFAQIHQQPNSQDYKVQVNMD